MVGYNIGGIPLHTPHPSPSTPLTRPILPHAPFTARVDIGSDRLHLRLVWRSVWKEEEEEEEEEGRGEKWNIELEVLKLKHTHTLLSLYFFREVTRE